MVTNQSNCWSLQTLHCSYLKWLQLVDGHLCLLAGSMDANGELFLRFFP